MAANFALSPTAIVSATYVPAKRSVNPHGLFDRSTFSYQAETDTLLCAEGKTLTRKQLESGDAFDPLRGHREGLSGLPKQEPLYQICMASRLAFHR